MTIAYDGTRYAGWQAQRRGGSGGKPTVQETLEKALRRILREPVRIVGSGRTDAGVHAEAQVAHVRTRASIPAWRLLRAANALLPADLAVTRIEEAGNSFHARFGAKRKRYRYRIFTAPVVPPFIRPYVAQVRVPLDVARMRREAAALRGRHDFRAFARAGSVGEGRSAVRAIAGVALRRREHELHLDIEGNGFLHTMVRTIAGTLIDVGRGRLPSGTVRRMLRTGSRSLAGTVAPAQGLTLRAVTYRNAS